MNSLYQKSIQIIIENQAPSGAFVACPSFAWYRYAWFRDGSFCAHALLQAGYAENVASFHGWASRVVLKYKDKMARCIEAARLGNPPPANECLHSRFTVEGREVPGNWGHHQLDGLGTWLWSLNEFMRSRPGMDVPQEWRQAACLAKDYLAALWPYPCSDCWEENETRLHTYTLAAIYAGLAAYGELFTDPTAGETAAQVRAFSLENGVADGRFIKSIGLPEVDANLIGVGYPYRLVAWDDARFQKTLACIRRELATPTGLHRYRRDTYYGSGEWLLLTGWLGWALTQHGEIQQAQAILAWMEEQASPKGELPEQVPHGLFNKAFFPVWVEKWGQIASPLLWSHAMYILLFRAIMDMKAYNK